MPGVWVARLGDV